VPSLTEKLRSFVRGVVSGFGSRPDVAAGIAAGFLYLLLPAALGLNYRLLAQKGPYQLMWLNLLGANYRLPLETPKPLHVLLAGLLGSGLAFYAVTCAMVGICVWASVRLGKAITGSHWPGLVAAVTVFALRGEFVSYVLIGGTEPLHIALVLLSVLALAGGRTSLAAFAVFAACLQRPEAWSLAPLPLLLALVTRRRFNLALLLPFVAPFVWMVFDRAMTGDWLYSLHLTAHYPVASALSASPTGSFWGDITLELAKVAGDVPLVVGLAGLGIWLWKHTRSSRGAESRDRQLPAQPTGLLTAAVGLALALPLAASWAASLSGHVLQMGRFQYPSAVLLVLLAACAPFFLFSGRAPRWFAVAMSAVVGLSAFAPKEIARSIHRARVDAVRATVYNPIANTVKRLVEDGSADVAIVSQRRLDYFAKLLGPSNSWKLLSVREVKNVAGTIPVTTKSGVLVYYSGDEIYVPVATESEAQERHGGASINQPSTDSAIRWVIRAWPTDAVLDTIAMLPDSLGGVWLIRSTP
jgi:hypothetical protein